MEFQETLFFIVDARSGARQDLPSLAKLKLAAQNLGGTLKLEPVSVVYDRYGYGLVDLIPLGAFAVLPLPVFFYLSRGLPRLRATRPLRAAQSDSSFG